MMASNTSRGGLLGRPAPAARLYCLSGSRAGCGTSGSTRLQNSSVTSHELACALAIDTSLRAKLPWSRAEAAFITTAPEHQGKGVATAAGVLLGLNPWLGVATLVTWLAVAFAFRYSSLAALVAAVFAPFYYGLLFGVEPQLFAVFAMSALLVFRHAKNISNLIAGKESRIGSKAKGK